MIKGKILHNVISEAPFCICTHQYMEFQLWPYSLSNTSGKYWEGTGVSWTSWGPYSWDNVLVHPAVLQTWYSGRSRWFSTEVKHPNILVSTVVPVPKPLSPSLHSCHYVGVLHSSQLVIFQCLDCLLWCFLSSQYSVLSCWLRSWLPS